MNIRNVKPEDLAEQIEFFSVDVSFISLHHIFPGGTGNHNAGCHGRLSGQAAV